jgi:hypothetical protein
MGRPKATHPRSHRIVVRLTQDELTLLTRLAGHDTIATVVRQALSDYAELMGLLHEPPAPKPRRPERRQPVPGKRARAYAQPGTTAPTAPPNAAQYAETIERVCRS